MKIAIIIIRILTGLMFLFSAVVVLFNLMPPPEMQGNVKLFNEGLAAAVYFVPVLKVIELLCALAFLSGRFIPLATIVIFPVTVNILLFHLFLAPEGLVIAVFLFLSNLFLAYAYRKNYQLLLAVK